MTTRAAPGQLVLVVGPSGAGKDTLIDAARRRFAGDERFQFPARIVSRPSSAAERNEFLPADVMEASALNGEFALHWTAHGHSYAIPGSVAQMIADGCCVVCNVSRSVIADARRLFPTSVVEVTASPEILAARLSARMRASDGDIGLRIARATALAASADTVIQNDSSLETAIRDFCAAIERAAGEGVAHRISAFG